jgi:aspartyl-tRNA(Asn)/glutamyl-tRNA(Gln) amidotransferase subunit B
MVDYEIFVGLEVHMQISTESKIFCECSTRFGARPNINTCVICTSQPGSIPILNKKAVESIIKTGIALNFAINKKCMFFRKQYFYPDIPKNYQITQFEPPLCSRGKLAIFVDGKEKIINMTRMHLEEDAGKLVHEIGNRKLNYSLLDLNRAGVGLMELVTEPELKSPYEAFEFLKELKNIVEHLGTSECSMEEGKMRCDVNVSVRPIGQKNMGTKIEIKNINSLTSVKNAIAYEVERQKKVLRFGGSLLQETRLWEMKEGITKSMRSKEDTLDYRYFPEPDLVPFNLSESFIENLRGQIPELPKVRKLRFMKNYGLPEYTAGYLISKKTIADYYEESLAFSKNKKASARLIANWISTELSAKLNASKMCIEKSPISSRNVAKLVEFILDGTISGKIAKLVFEKMYEESLDPETIIKEKKLMQISDNLTITRMCEDAINESSDAVAEYKSGKSRAIYAIVGLVMKKSCGRANPKIVNEVITKKLKS